MRWSPKTTSASSIAPSCTRASAPLGLGLLVPDKQNTQYQMNQTCKEDMAFITELKQLHFSLQEIHNILSYKRITHFTEENDIHYFVNLLTEKKAKLAVEQNQIAQTIQRIDQIIAETQRAQVKDSGKGMPLSFVPYLYCPSCRHPLKILRAFARNDETVEKTGGVFQTGGNGLIYREQ